MVYRAVQVLAHHRVQHDNRLVLMYTGFIEENKKHSSFIAYTVYYISCISYFMMHFYRNMVN